MGPGCQIQTDPLSLGTRWEFPAYGLRPYKGYKLGYNNRLLMVENKLVTEVISPL